VLLTAKATFARFDLWHALPLLALLILIVVLTPLSEVPKIRRRVLVSIVASVAVMELGLATAGAFAFGYPDRIVVAVQAPSQAIDRLLTLALPGHVDRRIQQAKARQRELYAIPHRFIQTIGSSTVHIDPTEASAAWAYDFNWRPVPVFQTYQAYAPSLDNLNSESLIKGRPQFVLSRLSSASPAIGIIDGRVGVQESPRYSRALLCNYAVEGIEDNWALFRYTGNRCGPLTALFQVDVRQSEVIEVPAPTSPGTAVLAEIDLQPTVVDTLLQGTVASVIIPTIALDGVTYRFMTPNAAEPFLVNVPSPVNGTNLEIHARKISIGRVPALGQAPVAARIHFYEMRVDQ
jgi:hypothetical protein